MQEATASATAALEGPQRSNPQVTVALISAVATVITAVIGLLVANNPWDRGSTSTDSQSIASESPGNPPVLSDEAKLLIDPNAKDCTANDAPDTPSQDSVTIESPASGAVVLESAPKRADVPMSGSFNGRAGDALYVFSYHPSICMYFFNPPDAVPTTAGRWERTAVLIDSAGEKVGLVAAVVDRKTDDLLQEVIRHGGDDAYLMRLPTRIQTARISVHVRPAS